MEEGLGSRLMQQIRETCELAGIKTEEYARISRKRLDVLSLEREIAKQKSALGRRVYELGHLPDPGEVLADPQVRAVIARVHELEASLAVCAQEIGEIQDASRGRTREVRERYAAERVSPRPREVPPPPEPALEEDEIGAPNDSGARA
jgi:hypothetical protein